MGENGVMHGTGKLFALRGLESGDQGKFHLLNFEGMEGLKP
jgi:hypothetical protein